MNTENENLEFLEALAKLPTIRRNVINITEEIIQKAKTTTQENSMIEEKISTLLLQMKAKKYELIEEDEMLLKYGIKMLITSQLPASKMAAKLRSLKKKSS